MKYNQDDKAYYFSSFEGLFFLKNGAYSKSIHAQKVKTIANKFIIVLNINNAFAIIWLTFLNYRSTEKLNDNKVEVKKLDSIIYHLQQSNDSFSNIIKKGAIQEINTANSGDIQ